MATWICHKNNDFNYQEMYNIITRAELTQTLILGIYERFYRDTYETIREGGCPNYYLCFFEDNYFAWLIGGHYSQVLLYYNYEQFPCNNIV